MNPLDGAVIDTNVFIAAARGHFLLPTPRLHSVLTRIEMLSFSMMSSSELDQTRLVLRQGTEVPVTDEIAEEAARLRRDFGGKLPDAVIVATALAYKVAVATFDRGMLRYVPEVDLPLLSP